MYIPIIKTYTEYQLTEKYFGLLVIKQACIIGSKGSLHNKVMECTRDNIP